MKKVLKIVVPVLLTLAIVLCIGWYFLKYNNTFTRDILLQQARDLQQAGKQELAIWFYDLAYRQSDDNDSIAIELSQYYKQTGNYTKAEYTLSKAIEDGGSVALYTALSQTYLEQNKLRDAVMMLDKVSDPALKADLDVLRPAAPKADAASGTYMQYISVAFSADGDIYVNALADYPSLHTDGYEAPIRLSDGQTTLFAVCVGENGLVSPLAVYHYVVGSVVEEVTFADAAFEAAVRTQLGVDAQYTIYSNELWELTHFTVPADANSCQDLKWMPYLEELTLDNCGFTDLQVLSDMKALKTLSVHGSKVSASDLEVILHLPLLTSLTLRDCAISSITPLAACTNLTYLDLSENAIRDISALSSLTKLQQLVLRSNAVIDPQAISTLTELTVLDLSYNSLVSTNALSTLTKLTELDVSANDLMKLEGLHTLTELRHFAASHNNLTDINILGSCTQLETLDVSHNTLITIDVIAKLKNLETLNFSHNEISYLPKLDTDCALHTIDGSYNALTSLNPLSKLENLRYVYMDYADTYANQYNTGSSKWLTNIDSLQYCPNLQEVHVYGTKVRNVSALSNKGIFVRYTPL